MEKISTYILFFITIFSYCQETNYNPQDGYIAGGYDVVSYFSNEAIKGSDKYTFTYDNVKFKFSNEANFNLFKSTPEKYIPQYGGWCAYAIALKNKRVTIDPNTYEIREGKLYMFYKTKFINTYKKWLEKNPKILIHKANVNWADF
jgi:hypothetical protein